MKNYNDIYDKKQKMCALMDEAYGKGYDEACDDCEIASKESYQKGLDDAWKCASRIAVSTSKGGLSVVEAYEIFGMHWDEVFSQYSASKAIAKIKEYEEKKKAVEEIKAGDEVVHIEKGTTRIITKIVDANYANYIDADGTVGYINPAAYKKTGRHFDIQSILDQMKDE